MKFFSLFGHALSRLSRLIFIFISCFILISIGISVLGGGKEAYSLIPYFAGIVAMVILPIILVIFSDILTFLGLCISPLILSFIFLVAPSHHSEASAITSGLLFFVYPWLCYAFQGGAVRCMYALRNENFEKIGKIYWIYTIFCIGLTAFYKGICSNYSPIILKSFYP